MTGKRIKQNIMLKVQIPKQFKSELEVEMSEKTKEVVTYSTQVAFWIQMVICFVIVMSFKVIWGMHNAMQVFIFMGLMIQWPATMDAGLNSIYQAVSFAFITDNVKLVVYGDYESDG